MDVRSTLEEQTTRDDLDTSFLEAAERVRAANDIKLTDAQRLELYSLFKQSTEGDNKTPAPGLLDFVGRSKWNKWKELEALPLHEAKARYVSLVARLIPHDNLKVKADERARGGGGAAEQQSDRGGEEGSGGEGASLGNRMSTPGVIGLHGLEGSEAACMEGGEEEEERNVFYYARRGDVKEVTARLGDRSAINQQDEEGRTLLHWAADGGHAELVQALIAAGADLSIKDSEGDTPLDYAQTCEYADIVALLTSKVGQG